MFTGLVEVDLPNARVIAGFFPVCVRCIFSIEVGVGVVCLHVSDFGVDLEEHAP